ncbi:MAG: hypothetical protein L0387_44610 [Acidobacteria bacterium]|nr:hypothetical protein [Acidobacteriota bacterium]MCI0628662.1 hypothetical protein [Acidobacteriota bacterium]MCI0719053.1 hypothetical protein [Acidobacteriota bacterium]
MTSERDQSVRIQLMFTLGECDGDELAQSAMSALLERQASDVYLRQAALSGLAARELVFLERLLEGKAWQTEKAGYREIFKELAAILLRRGEADAVEQLFSRIAAQPETAAWPQTAMLEGILSVSGQVNPAGSGWSVVEMHVGPRRPFQTLSFVEGTQLRPTPSMQSMTFPVGAINVLENSASSSYQSGFILAKRRFSKGLTFLSSYTYAKSLTGAPAFRSPAMESEVPQNSFDLRTKWGRAAATFATALLPA